jgi:hypothetical protein
MEQALEQRIRQRAYEIWDAVGRPQGASELALACCGARGSRCLCRTDGPSAAKVYSAQIGSSRETRFVAKSQDSVISLRAAPPSAFRGARTGRSVSLECACRTAHRRCQASRPTVHLNLQRGTAAITMLSGR